MHEARIAVRLASLIESPGYTVDRFDDGPPFAGRIAVLPSAFNPPTRAHIGLLELASGLPEIAGTAAALSTSNVDKSVFGAPLAYRVGMLLALREEVDPPAAVLVTNAARLVDQGDALRLHYPAAQFDFVVGFDTLIRVFDERYYERMDESLARFFAHHRLIAANRAQASIDAVREFLLGPAAAPWSSGILVCELDHLRAAISSTGAREQAGRGETSDALTANVHAYIQQHRLYGAGEDGGR